MADTDNKPDPDKPATGEPGSNPEDQLGDAGKRAIAAVRAERDAERTKVAELTERLTQLEDAGRTDEQRKAAAAEADKAARAADTARADKAEAKLARIDAAIAAGLDPKHAARLVGDTPEELAADAKSYAETLGVSVEQQRRDSLVSRNAGNDGSAKPSTADMFAEAIDASGVFGDSD